MHSKVEFKAPFLSLFVLENIELAQLAAMFSIFSLGELRSEKKKKIPSFFILLLICVFLNASFT